MRGNALSMVFPNLKSNKERWGAIVDFYPGDLGSSPGQAI